MTKGKKYSSNEDKSNGLNPNNEQHKANKLNEAHQKTPGHPANPKSIPTDPKKQK